MHNQHSEDDIEPVTMTPYIYSTDVSSKQHNVFLDGELGPPAQYRDLIMTLFTAQPHDEVVLFLNSPGGHLETAMAIIDAITMCQAPVQAVLVGQIFSAISLITMYCNKVVVCDHATMMVHTASFGTAGLMANVQTHTKFTVEYVQKIMNEAYEGFLDPLELNKMQEGSELWFNAQEIKQRLTSRKELLRRKGSFQETAATTDAVAQDSISG